MNGRWSPGACSSPPRLAGSAKVAIIGQTTARELFGDADPLEQVIRVRKVPVTIVGLLAAKGQNANGQDQDDVLMLPISTYRNRIQGGWGGKARRIGSITVKVREGQSMKAAEDNIKDLLRQRFKIQPNADDSFTIRNLSEILQAQEASSRVMTHAAGGGGGHQPGDRRHRHHEHHAGQRHRTHARDRPAHGSGGACA